MAKLIVVKVGGCLMSYPKELREVAEVLAELAHLTQLAIVPGGGKLAREVRGLQEAHRLSDETAHWMAVLAQDQYGLMLAELTGLPAAASLAELKAVGSAVLLPYRVLRALDLVPHSWEATGDSIAAAIAKELSARKLILVKCIPLSKHIEAPPSDLKSRGIVDSYFPTAAQSLKVAVASALNPNTIREAMSSSYTSNGREPLTPP
ncbi:MAG: hypothetical protein DRN99_09925 [Thermoproteota archaeon]|nr:MAG: hypothetical protein DRN99_09925 [Candidatus Korarchaeota archaeon]